MSNGQNSQCLRACRIACVFFRQEEADDVRQYLAQRSADLEALLEQPKADHTNMKVGKLCTIVVEQLFAEVLELRGRLEQFATNLQ